MFQVCGFCSDQNKVVLRNVWGATEVWDLTSRKKAVNLGGYGSGRVLTVVPASDLVAFGATNSAGAAVINLWSCASNSIVATIPDMGDVVSITASYNGKMLAIYTSSRGIQIWNADNGTTVPFCAARGGGGAYQGVLAFSFDGKWLAVGETDGRLRIIDVATKEQKIAFEASSDGITALVFSPWHIGGVGVRFF